MTAPPKSPGGATSQRGLEGVVAGRSALSFIDGREGILTYRGYDIHDLSREASFEEVLHLLWFGSLPSRKTLEDLRARLAEERPVPCEIHALIRSAPREKPPMEVLRAAVSALSLNDAEANDPSEESNIRKAIRLTARLPGVAGAIHRMAAGKEPVVPREDLSHAGNFLFGVSGDIPDARRERMFDKALVLHADHGFNASTFAARVTAATLSDMYSTVTSAVSTLKGPLHGGANERVMRMLLDIETPERAAGWVREALGRKQRIFGFGHRVYKVEDPRATVLRELSREAGELAGDTKWFEVSEAVETAVKAEKGLFPNVDFYSASFYYALGLPVSLFVPIFAVGRVGGWTAHVLEQLSDNRLIRPRSDYIGEKPGRKWVPMDARPA